MGGVVSRVWSGWSSEWSSKYSRVVGRVVSRVWSGWSSE